MFSLAYAAHNPCYPRLPYSRVHGKLVVQHVSDDKNVFFFFQAEDGIRDIGVTGVQTCALPIHHSIPRHPALAGESPPERYFIRSRWSCPADPVKQAPNRAGALWPGTMAEEGAGAGLDTPFVAWTSL